MRLLLLGFVLSVLTLADHSEAQERSRGAVLALSCAGCHGTDGMSPGAMPAHFDRLR
ncbi:c-type cytochrome [Minwuia thermotolerans]|uniref:c-type cytochrome n=1 Tax=Minwuia thermotolerans TaxID=2056226 RepID=UPI0013DE4838|nr:cytochrome c [Minwuia thermotolerans]